MQTDILDTPTPDQRKARKRLLTKTHLGSSSGNSVFASSSTEAPQETDPDWSSSDTALEIHFENKPGNHALQKTCRDMSAFVTGAARQGRKEVFFPHSVYALGSSRGQKSPHTVSTGEYGFLLDFAGKLLAGSNHCKGTIDPDSDPQKPWFWSTFVQKSSNVSATALISDADEIPSNVSQLPCSFLVICVECLSYCADFRCR